MTRPEPAPATPLPPIRTSDAARQLIARFDSIMTSLLQLLEEETEIVRAGLVSEVPRLEVKKSELARLYLADAALVRAHCAFMAVAVPSEFVALRQRHETFHALLQINLAVLATAHAVSEGIIRGVASSLARKAAPQTYGMSGRATAPAPTAVPPVALSRTL